MLIGIIFFLIFFFILALSRLDYALFFLITALPAYLIRFSIFGVPSTVLEVMILITFAVWFFKDWLPHFKNLLKKRAEKVRS